jgi:hypothetical protein
LKRFKQPTIPDSVLKFNRFRRKIFVRICATKNADERLNTAEEFAIAIFAAKVRWRGIEFSDGF